MYKEKDFEPEQDQHKAKRKLQVFAMPLQGGLLGIKKKNICEDYINLIYLFNKKWYEKKLFIEV